MAVTRQITIPSVRSIPPNTDPSLRALLQSIIDIINIGEGITTTHLLEKKITRRDLEALGIDSSVIDNPNVSYNFGVSGGDSTPPLPISGLSYSIRAFANILTWTNPIDIDGDLASFYVYHNTSNSFATSTLIGIVPYPTNIYTHNGISYIAGTDYYWVVSVDRSGNSSTSVSTSVTRDIKEDINTLLDQLFVGTSGTSYANDFRIIANAFTIWQPSAQIPAFNTGENYSEGDIVYYDGTATYDYFFANTDVSAGGDYPDASSDWVDFDVTTVSTAAKTVFRIGEVEGVTTMGLRGDFIVDGGILARTIAAGTITGTHIAAQTITSDNITVGTLTGSTIAAQTITGDLIAGGTITGTNIAGGTITGTHIASQTITANNIASNTITVSNLATGSGSLKTLITPTGTGLFLSQSVMGYYKGTGWITYIDASGNAAFGSTVGTNYLQWLQGTGILTVAGDIKTHSNVGTGQQGIHLSRSENELYFWGDRGDGTIAKVVSVGLSLYGSDYIFIDAGGATSGWTNLALRARAYDIQAAVVSTLNPSGESLSVSNTYAGVGTPVGLRVITSGSTGYGITAYSTIGTGLGTAVYGAANSSAGFDFYANGAGTNYGPFTGGHEGLVEKSFNAEVGDILIDASVYNKRNVSNCICINTLSSIAQQTGVIGVFSSMSEFPDLENEYDYKEPDKKIKISRISAFNKPGGMTKEDILTYEENRSIYNLITFNAVGEGQINVCDEGGNISIGDYICASNTPGKGMRQDDDLYHNYTVAKARESVDWSSESSNIKMIACIYLCG